MSAQWLHLGINFLLPAIPNLDPNHKTKGKGGKGGTQEVDGGMNHAKSTQFPSSSPEPCLCILTISRAVSQHHWHSADASRTSRSCPRSRSRCPASRVSIVAMNVGHANRISISLRLMDVLRSLLLLLLLLLPSCCCCCCCCCCLVWFRWCWWLSVPLPGRQATMRSMASRCSGSVGGSHGSVCSQRRQKRMQAQ